MSPIFALLLCIVFVLFLLRLERKQSPNVSFALWIPTIWMLLAAIKPLGIWFGGGGATMEEGSQIDRAVLSIILFLGLLVLIRRQFKWASAIQENPLLMLLIGYIFVSILWSYMPFVSFKRWTRELIAVVMLFVVKSEPEPRQAIQSLLRRTVYILIPFSYIVIHYFPEYGRMYSRWSGELMWTGVSLHKNGLAVLCFFSAFFLIWTLIRRWKGSYTPVLMYQTPVEVFLLFLTIWLFMGPNHTLTYSATSFVALAVGLTGLFGLLWLKKLGILIDSKVLTIIVGFLIVYGTITPFAGKLSIIDISSTLNRDKTLTDRSRIWAFLVPYAMQKPLWGNGFGGFWTDAIREMSASDAHNGYLDIILNLGFAGLILFSMFFLSCCRRLQKILLYEFDLGTLGICFLLMLVVHNIGESSNAGLTGNIMFIILILTVYSTTITSSKQVRSVNLNGKGISIGGD